MNPWYEWVAFCGFVLLVAFAITGTSALVALAFLGRLRETLRSWLGIR